MKEHRMRYWVVDCVAGVIVAGLAGAILAVNILITLGIGHDVTLFDVFDRHVSARLLILAILVGGPLVGTLAMRHRRYHVATPTARRSTR